MTGRDYLKIPELDKIFDSAYRAGARVHTNSWGNMGGIYGQLSMDVDKYLHQHEDFFVLFSAGNDGYNGLKSVIAPGNAKNCLTVGATQVRTVAQDESLNDQVRLADHLNFLVGLHVAGYSPSPTSLDCAMVETIVYSVSLPLSYTAVKSSCLFQLYRSNQ